MILGVVFALVLLQAPAATTGTICVSDVPRPTPGPTSLANPTGGKPEWAFTVQIDDGERHATTADKSVLIGDVTLGARHLVTIRDRGKIVTSFKFTFEEYRSPDLCLWFNELYETWSVWTKKNARHLCKCEK